MFPSSGFLDYGGVGAPSTPTPPDGMGLGGESILHFPSYISSPTRGISSYGGGCSSPVPPHLATLIQTICSPVKSAQPPIAGPKLPSVFQQPTTPVSEHNILPFPQLSSEFPLIPSPPPSHSLLFSPPPPNTPPPQHPGIHFSNSKMIPTTKESFFTRFGRRITKSGSKYLPHQVSKHNDDGVNKNFDENVYSYCDWTQDEGHLTPPPPGAATPNQIKDHCVGLTKADPDTGNNSEVSPVTDTANIFNEQLAITNQTPGVQALSSQRPGTPVSSCPATPGATSPTCSSTPTSKSPLVEVTGSGEASCENSFYQAIYQETGVHYTAYQPHQDPGSHQNISIPQSGVFHQEGANLNPVLSPQLSMNPFMFQVLCPPFL
jgi:hypothetical protein